MFYIWIKGNRFSSNGIFSINVCSCNFWEIYIGNKIKSSLLKLF